MLNAIPASAGETGTQMKRVIAVMGVLLAGCSSLGGQQLEEHRKMEAIFSDMKTIDFVGMESKAPPAEIVGTWTGNLGPSLSTLKIAADGTGLLCAANVYGAYSVTKIKFDGTQVRNQGGGRYDVTAVDQNTINVHMPYFKADPPSRFYRDTDLSKATGDCAKGL